MKKIFLALLVFLASVNAAYAQVEIGLKVSPSVTSLRAESPSGYGFRSDGSKLSFGGGLVVDYFFGENYAFSTGLLLSGKGGTIKYLEALGGPAVDPARGTQKITMQYLELPLTVKLFTNEVAPAARLYFQVGGSLNVPISTRINNSKFYTDPNGKETKAGDHTTFYDADVLAGIGAEYQLGQSTKVFGGISYHRGLVNIDDYFEDSRGFKDIVIKNSSVNLDLGIKF